MEIKSTIFFADENIKKEFNELNNGKIEEQELYLQLKQAFENLKTNAFCGIQIPKKLIPKVYTQKYGIDNLWEYNLPNAWRLLYSVGREGIKVISIIEKDLCLFLSSQGQTKQILMSLTIFLNGLTTRNMKEDLDIKIEEK